MRNKILVGLVSAFTLALCAGIAFGCSKPQIPPDPGQDDVSVTLSQTELTMVIGEERSIYATVENSDEAVVWSSTNPDVATVESGKITALNDGEAVIVGTVGEAHGSCHLVVSSTESIVLNRARVRLFKGDTVQLDAQLKLGLLPSDGAVSWKSENEAVATVSDGLVTAAKVGETTITATSVSGKTASCVVKVEDVVVIALSKNEVTLHPNSTASADITVSGKKGDYNLTASSINWQSSNENIATVSATGNGARITAKKSGNAVITATVAGSSEVAVCLVDSWYALS